VGHTLDNITSELHLTPTAPAPALPPARAPRASSLVLTRERSVSQPFHFAFFVRDLASTRRLEFKSFRHPEHVFAA
jgi:hypothetical protein